MPQILVCTMIYPFVLLLKIIYNASIYLFSLFFNKKTIILLIFIFDMKKMFKVCLSFSLSLSWIICVIIGSHSHPVFRLHCFPTAIIVHSEVTNIILLATLQLLPFALRQSLKCFKWTSKDLAFLFSLVSRPTWLVQLQDESIKFLNSLNLLIF